MPPGNGRGGVYFCHRSFSEIPIKQFSLAAISIRVHITHSEQYPPRVPERDISNPHESGILQQIKVQQTHSPKHDLH